MQPAALASGRACRRLPLAQQRGAQNPPKCSQLCRGMRQIKPQGKTAASVSAHCVCIPLARLLSLVLMLGQTVTSLLAWVAWETLGFGRMDMSAAGIRAAYPAQDSAREPPACSFWDSRPDQLKSPRCLEEWGNKH